MVKRITIPQILIWLSAAYFLVTAPAWGARVALVIGNANYPESPLKNPVNDARAMSAKLKSLGFEVIAKEDLQMRQIGSTLNAFRSKIKPGDEVLFFYAGHGLQVKGVNYLPAVDAEIGSEDDVPQQSINVANLLELLDESKAGVKLIFLDACRNNPFSRGFRSTSTGLSKVGNAPSGTLISFATRPGSVAADGTGSNGLYTEQLLHYIATPNVQVELMLKEVARDVESHSQSKQEPWIEGSIKGNFYFVFTGPTTVNMPAPATVSVAKADPEEEAWNAAKDSNSVAAVQLYLNRYKNGRYQTAAEILLTKLSPAQQPPNKPTVVAQPQIEIYTVGRSFRDCRDNSCPEMVVMPSGSFLMGSPENEQNRGRDEGPQHLATIAYRVAIGKYEVTFEEWDACSTAGACIQRPGDNGWGRGRQPVINVSWDDAQQYVHWLSNKTGKQYRLPSETEWEYAARAGTNTPFFTGQRLTINQANFDPSFDWNTYYRRSGINQELARQKPLAVGSFAPNAFGLYDMHGNVSEWVQDCYQPNYNDISKDGSAFDKATCNIRVVRGGSWGSVEWVLRSAKRRDTAPDDKYYALGFRVARTVP
jgi:formylglycine-generating enzyme required for sulfatase activity